MEKKKVIELKIIENRKKSKKNKENFENLKKDFYELIDNIIEIDFINIKNKESKNYIKTNLIEFLKLYINLNRNIINMNESNKIVKSIVDNLINSVIFRIDNIKDKELIKNIDLTKIKEKIEINSVKKI